MPDEHPPEEGVPQIAVFHAPLPGQPGPVSRLGRIPKRLIFIGLGLIVEVVIIIVLLASSPEQEQKKVPAPPSTQHRRQ
jgi:hypothetical protein